MTPRAIWVTILPAERRARNPYQFAAMLMIIAVSISQLSVGPIAASSLNYLPTGQVEWLSWSGIIAGAAGAISAGIPERTVIFRLWCKQRRRIEFDATWSRLCVELAAHGLLIFVLLSYYAAFTLVRPISEGLSLASGAALFFAGSAAWRFAQILWTIKRAMLDPPGGSTIIGARTAGLDDG